MPRVKGAANRKLKGIHLLAMIRLLKGESTAVIARDLGTSESAVRAWQNWPEFRERMDAQCATQVRDLLDRGALDGVQALTGHAEEIAQWMRRVVTGEIKLERTRRVVRSASGEVTVESDDQQRWQMALDFLHHAGIADQGRLPAVPPGVNVSVVNQNAQLDVDLQRQLAVFAPPPEIGKNGHRD